MKAVCGFICEVCVKDEFQQIHYTYAGRDRVLEKGEVFIGYFRQVTKPSGSVEYAYLTRMTLLDPRLLICREEEDAIFDYTEVDLKIIALRGPRSNNRYLDKKYLKLPTWEREHSIEFIPSPPAEDEKLPIGFAHYRYTIDDL